MSSGCKASNKTVRDGDAEGREATVRGGGRMFCQHSAEAQPRPTALPACLHLPSSVSPPVPPACCSSRCRSRLWPVHSLPSLKAAARLIRAVYVIKPAVSRCWPFYRSRAAASSPLMSSCSDRLARSRSLADCCWLRAAVALQPSLLSFLFSLCLVFCSCSFRSSFHSPDHLLLVTVSSMAKHIFEKRSSTESRARVKLLRRVRFLLLCVSFSW